MPYTWRGSSAVGYDLARMSGGAGVAGVLANALRADADYATALADIPPPAASDRDRGRALVCTRGSGVVTNRGASPRAVGLDDLWLGSAADLLALVDLDVATAAGLSAAGKLAAEEHLRDAVVAHLLAAGGERELAGTLAAGYGRVPRDGPAAADLGPGGADVAHVLRLVATGRSADPLGLLTTTRRADAGARWVSAMHGVSWAAELSGRTRPLACANMFLVHTLAEAAYSAEDCVRGVWNAASGIVSALVVADLLPDHDVGFLTRA